MTSGSASFGNASIASTTVTLTSGNATVQANFSLNTYQLTVAAGTGGTTNPTGTSTVNALAATPIAATANAGYLFLNWTVTAGSASIGDASMASTTATLTSGDATVQANFVRPRYRSVATGNWTSSSTWEISADGAVWIAATSTPTSADDSITVRNGHVVSLVQCSQPTS